jgi:hypothetical protein
VHERTVQLAVRQTLRLRKEFQEETNQRVTLQHALEWIETGRIAKQRHRRPRDPDQDDIERLRRTLDIGLRLQARERYEHKNPDVPLRSRHQDLVNPRDRDPDDYAAVHDMHAPPSGRSWHQQAADAAAEEPEEAKDDRSELIKRVSNELRIIASAPSDQIVTELQGTKLVHDMLNALRTFFWEPSTGGSKKRRMEWVSYQQKSHLAMIASRLPFIYGLEDYNRHRAAIHAYWNIDPNHPSYVCIMIPRRHGKTIVSCDMIAVCLYFLPGDRILLLTIGDRVSSNTMHEYVIPRFRGLPGADAMIRTVNSEKFSVQSLGSEAGVVSNLYAHPMGGKVSRRRMG